MAIKAKKNSKAAVQATIKEVIINHLSKNKDVRNPMEIATKSGRAIKSIRQKLRELIEQGVVEAEYEPKYNHYVSLKLSKNMVDSINKGWEGIVNNSLDFELPLGSGINIYTDGEKKGTIVVPESVDNFGERALEKSVVGIDPSYGPNGDMSGEFVFINGQMLDLKTAHENGLVSDDEVSFLIGLSPVFKSEAFDPKQFEDHLSATIEHKQLDSQKVIEVAQESRNQQFLGRTNKSLSQYKDEQYGEIGTEKRDTFEKEVREEIENDEKGFLCGKLEKAYNAQNGYSEGHIENLSKLASSDADTPYGDFPTVLSDDNDWITGREEEISNENSTKSNGFLSKIKSFFGKK